MRRTYDLVCRLSATTSLVAMCLVSGCSEPPKAVKPTPKPYVKPEAPAYETPTVENTEERAAEVRKVCTRKAQTSPDLSSCWMQEAERSGGKKFEAEIRISMLISPDGKAQEASVLNGGQRKELESCVLEVVKGWSYPSGQTVTPVQCNFYLRPIM